jgi:hypothetical protein
MRADAMCSVFNYVKARSHRDGTEAKLREMTKTKTKTKSKARR